MTDQSRHDDLTVMCQDLIDREPVKVLAALKDPVSMAATCLVARYSHEAMIQLMIDHPEWSHAQLSHFFGRPPSWMSTVLASEQFQSVLDTRRHEVADPSLTATMEERFRALALRATTVLQEKLNSPGVNDLVVLKAAEIGVKALGLGQRPVDAPALPAPVNSSQSAAEKILAAMDALDARRQAAKDEAIDVDANEVPSSGECESD